MTILIQVKDWGHCDLDGESTDEYWRLVAERNRFQCFDLNSLDYDPSTASL